MSTSKGLDFSINKNFLECFKTGIPVQDAIVHTSFHTKYGFPQTFDIGLKFNRLLHPSAKAVIDFIGTLVDPDATVDPTVRDIVNMLRTNFVTFDENYPQHIPGKTYIGVVNVTPLDFDNSFNARVKEVGSMLQNFLFDHDVDDIMVLQLMQGIKTVTIKLKSEHVIVQDEVKGYDNPKSKSATIVATEDKLARLAADREARRRAKLDEIPTLNESNPTEEQLAKAQTSVDAKVVYEEALLVSAV